MNNNHPHIITINQTQYQLGKLKGNTIHYNFDKILEFLEAKGKNLFGANFKLYQEDIPIIYKLCIYIIQDEASCRKVDININKGLLLTGPVGCGKTTLMKLLKHIVPHHKPYEVIPARNITFAFNNIGYKTIEDYGNEGFYCFDDLGVEPTGRHYGKDCNVMGEILLSRYELFTSSCHLERSRRVSSTVISSAVEKSHIHQKLTAKGQRLNLTHATTNLNAQELENRYGNRVRSRMRQVFNLVAFDKESIDKRI